MFLDNVLRAKQGLLQIVPEHYKVAKSQSVANRPILNYNRAAYSNWKNRVPDNNRPKDHRVEAREKLMEQPVTPLEKHMDLKKILLEEATESRVEKMKAVNKVIPKFVSRDLLQAVKAKARMEQWVDYRNPVHRDNSHLSSMMRVVKIQKIVLPDHAGSNR